MEKSLRQKRSGKLKISAPTLISAPVSATTNTVDIQSSIISSRPAPFAPGTAAALRLVPTNASQESIPRSVISTRSKDDKTADLVKRRYSTRFNVPGQGDDGVPMPSVPALPSQFAPRKMSRDGDVPKSGRVLTVEPGVLQDGNFRPEECWYHRSWDVLS
jgi:hypothetical protein